MQSRSPVRTNAIVFSVLGVVVGLLIHFIVLSSSRYNWIDPVQDWRAVPEASIELLNVLMTSLMVLI